jgi:bifunctional non-homologous end joining protein LigD
VLLPHLAGRPLTLGRWPQGVEGRGFAQTECRGAPPWVATQPLRLRDGRVRNFCVVDGVPSLLWVANLGTIELHPLLGGSPPTAVFDLDPGEGVGFAQCCDLALALRELLREAGLAGFAKSSGGAGLHVYVPLNVAHSGDQVKAFARATADRLAAERPEQATASTAKSDRRGKVLVDWLQNDPMRSTVSVYSLRAASSPTVSTPITWDEVERREPLVVGPEDVLARVEVLGDLFAPVLELEQRLP